MFSTSKMITTALILNNTFFVTLPFRISYDIELDKKLGKNFSSLHNCSLYMYIYFFMFYCNVHDDCARK